MAAENGDGDDGIPSLTYAIHASLTRSLSSQCFTIRPGEKIHSAQIIPPLLVLRCGKTN